MAESEERTSEEKALRVSKGPAVVSRWWARRKRSRDDD
jgi:hypothetical protein